MTRLLWKKRLCNPNSLLPQNHKKKRTTKSQSKRDSRSCRRMRFSRTLLRVVAAAPRYNNNSMKQRSQKKRLVQLFQLLQRPLPNSSNRRSLRIINNRYSCKSNNKFLRQSKPRPPPSTQSSFSSNETTSTPSASISRSKTTWKSFTR